MTPIELARKDFLKYVQLVTKDGQKLPLELTPLQLKLWKAFIDASKSGKPARWLAVKPSAFMRKG